MMIMVILILMYHSTFAFFTGRPPYTATLNLSGKCYVLFAFVAAAAAAASFFRFFMMGDEKCVGGIRMLFVLNKKCSYIERSICQLIRTAFFFVLY